MILYAINFGECETVELLDRRS